MTVIVFEKPAITRPLKRVALTKRCTGEYESSFYEFGRFTLSIHAKALYATEFQIGRIVRIDNDYWGIIKNRKVQRGSSNIITVSGLQLKGILWQRVTAPLDLAPENAPAGYDSKAGYTDEVMKYFVSNNTAGKRRFLENLEVEPTLKQGASDDKYYTRFENLGDVIAKLAKRTGIGWDIVGDEKTGKLRFDTKKGTDRTAKQKILSPAVFDLKIGTMSDFEYVEETENAANTFYCTKSGAEFEDEALTQTYYLDNEAKIGLSRVEKQLNISISDEENLFEEMEENARKEMESYRATETISVTPTRRLTPYVDYSIGDYATFVSRDDKINADKQITAIKTTVTDKSVTYSITLGDPQLNKFDYIAREIKNK